MPRNNQGADLASMVSTCPYQVWKGRLHLRGVRSQVRGVQRAEAPRLEVHQPMDPLLSLAAQLAKPATASDSRVLAAELLGPEEVRAIERACQQAVRTSADAVGQRLSSDESRHLISLLEALVRNFEDAGSLLAAANEEVFDSSDARSWNQAATRAGLDPSTLPVPLQELVSAFLEHLASAVRDESRRPDSALRPTLLLNYLQQMREDLDLLRLTAVDRKIARGRELSAGLARELHAMQDLCRRHDRAFHTPHLLLALLEIRGSVTWACFNDVRRNLAMATQEALRSYVRTDHGVPYIDVELTDYPVITLAQQLAVADRQPRVEEPHVLAAALRLPSTTQVQLRDWLGPRYRLLLARVAEARASWSTAQTPDFVVFKALP